MASVPMPREVDECDAHRDQIALNDAVTEGMRVGRLGLPCSLNPFARGELGHAEWLRGWHSAAAARASAQLALRARKCRYSSKPCDCGGRGLCLDVA